MRLHQLLVWLVVGALTGCAHIGQSTPEPTQSPVSSALAAATGAPPALPTQTAAPPTLTETQSATAQPTDPSTPVPTANPTPSPAPTAEPTSIWRAANIELPKSAQIIDVISTSRGFAAFGSVDEPATHCEWDVSGRVWTSPNGDDWTEVSIESARIELVDLVEMGGNLYAFGREGKDGCSVGNPLVWRSDDGREWSRLQGSDEWSDSWISAVDATGDTLVAVGDDDTEDDNRAGVWTSTDGVTWDRSSRTPHGEMMYLNNVFATDDTLLTWDSWSIRPFWRSVDQGRTWDQLDVSPLFELRSIDVAHQDGRFAVVSEACCSVPEEGFGTSLASTDGASWTFADPVGLRRTTPEVAAMPTGFVAIGEVTRVSTDGLSWLNAEPLPEYQSRGWTSSMASAETLVVFNGSNVWVADVADLDPALWTETPRLADRMRIGERYPFEPFNSCWPGPVQFDFGTWVTRYPEDFENFPDSIDIMGDRGWVTKLDDDLAQYESREGGVATMHRSDTPEQGGGCA